MNFFKKFVGQIAKLNNQRDEIRTEVLNDARLALEHTFQRRITKCIQILHQ
jgi:hypothetical protein